MDYVDAHFHVWELDRYDYEWPTASMKIYKDYYPSDYEKAIQGTPMKHGIFVQVLTRPCLEEAEWVMDMATRHSVIKGVVAGLDLTSPKLEENIVSLKTRGLLKGIRHDLDMESDDWITRDDVSQGLQTLAKHDLSYDLLVRPRHLPYIPGVVAKHPTLPFIINHIANPQFSEGKMDGWKDEMSAIAKYPNVYCKISGIISEQREDNWKTLDYQPYIDHVVDIFGVDRCLYGSDWPVFELVSASYKENFDVIKRALSKLTDEERNKVFRENAIKFYKLAL